MIKAVHQVVGAVIQFAVCAACVAAAVAPGVGHGQGTTLEAQVKATYLYNFIQFVEWPEESWTAGNEFQLCVIGNDRIGPALDAFEGERVDGRVIRVRRLSAPEEAAPTRCKLVFLPRGAGDSGQLLARIPHRGVLTVSDASNFINAGGMIGLYETRGRVRFSINDGAARRAGLVVSSRLLQLARERS